MTFNDFNLHEAIQSGLRDSGFSTPTPIQEQAIPVILQKKDLIGAAQTGTGKTAAFVLPILHQILERKPDRAQALILSPTRELAQQIDEQIFALGYHTGISSATIIGGEDFARQASALRSGVDIIVATPGRLIDQTKVLDIDFKHIRFLVLDEADRMLDMGFLPDVTKIIQKLPTDRQTLLFSATMPKQIQELAKAIMKEPEKVEIEISKPSKSIQQQAYLVEARQKLELVQHILESTAWDSCIIFCSTKRGTDQLEGLLTKKGIKAVSIHGDRSQEERNAALNAFKNKEIPVIVATDVIARGIDIANVSLIINYDVPRAVEDYIHRIGRTGRYDKTGVAVTLASKKDSRAFQAIQDKVGSQLQILEMPESKSEKSPNTKAKTKSAPKGNPPAAKTKAASETKPAARPKPKPEAKESKSKTAKPKPAASAKKGRANSPDKPKIEEMRKKVESLTTVKVRLRAPHSPSKKSAKKAARTPEIETERIDIASKRNQNARKPSKGIWGLIKSFLPKFK